MVSRIDKNNMYSNLDKNIDGNWYEPREHLKQLKGVIYAEYWEQTSSAGDWSGWFVAKEGNKYHLYEFSQENNWPHGGFTLYSNGVMAIFDTQPTKDEIQEFLLDRYA